MDISIGLPNTLSHPGPLVGEWARRAEERGFASLGTIDRIVYPSYDTMTTLAVAAGATSRIGLVSGVLLAPLYPPVWLAKAASSLHAMSGGRLTLGLGVGGREDDFEAMGRDMKRRGKDMDAALETMHTVWAGDTTAAPVTGQVPLLIGGTSDAAVRRTIAYGRGWIAGGGPPEGAAPIVARIREEWRAAGREGEPHFAALAYFGLGEEDASREALRSYYGFLGDYTDMVVEGALRTPEAIKEAVGRFEAAGIDEIIFDPTVASLDQVDKLADLVI